MIAIALVAIALTIPVLFAIAGALSIAQRMEAKAFKAGFTAAYNAR